jgi:hypothetical protein
MERTEHIKIISVRNHKRGAGMKKRLREVIDDILYEDLLRMRKDIDNGGHHLRTILDSKIKQIEREEVKVCAVCGNPINPHFMDDYSLIFGRYDFKKRAYFCGLDCLNFFLKGMNEKQKEKIIKEQGLSK